MSAKKGELLYRIIQNKIFNQFIINKLILYNYKINKLL